jgi:hypothetical protein
MNPQLLWVWIGIAIGTAAGITGAYAGWRQAHGGWTKGFAVRIVVVASALAAGGVLTILRLPVSWENRVCLLLGPAFLIFWVLRQLSAMRRG